MGYDSRLYLVRDSKVPTSSGKRYGLIIAMFEMGKTNQSLSHIFKEPSPCCFFNPGQNVEITHDMYGDECTYCEPELFCTEVENSEYEPWIRIAKAIRLLHEPNSILIHYGH